MAPLNAPIFMERLSERNTILARCTGKWRSPKLAAMAITRTQTHSHSIALRTAFQAKTQSVPATVLLFMKTLSSTCGGWAALAPASARKTPNLRARGPVWQTRTSRPPTSRLSRRHHLEAAIMLHTLPTSPPRCTKTFRTFI